MPPRGPSRFRTGGVLRGVLRVVLRLALLDGYFLATHDMKLGGMRLLLLKTTPHFLQLLLPNFARGILAARRLELLQLGLLLRGLRHLQKPYFMRLIGHFVQLILGVRQCTAFWADALQQFIRKLLLVIQHPVHLEVLGNGSNFNVFLLGSNFYGQLQWLRGLCRGILQACIRVLGLVGLAGLARSPRL